MSLNMPSSLLVNWHPHSVYRETCIQPLVSQNKWLIYCLYTSSRQFSQIPVMSLKRGRAALRRSIRTRFGCVCQNNLPALPSTGVLGLEVNVLTQWPFSKGSAVRPHCGASYTSFLHFFLRVDIVIYIHIYIYACT